MGDYDRDGCLTSSSVESPDGRAMTEVPIKAMTTLRNFMIVGGDGLKSVETDGAVTGSMQPPHSGVLYLLKTLPFVWYSADDAYLFLVSVRAPVCHGTSPWVVAAEGVSAAGAPPRLVGRWVWGCRQCNAVSDLRQKLTNLKEYCVGCSFVIFALVFISL